MERLLQLLEENARLSVEDLAAMLSSTPEEVAAKMDEYTKTGVIRGYKALVDCMTQLGFWADDAQVVSEIIEKFWAKTPGVYIRVDILQEEQ